MPLHCRKKRNKKNKTKKPSGSDRPNPLPLVW
jgi:hypothetical protein